MLYQSIASIKRRTILIYGSWIKKNCRSWLAIRMRKSRNIYWRWISTRENRNSRLFHNKRAMRDKGCMMGVVLIMRIWNNYTLKRMICSSSSFRRWELQKCTSNNSIRSTRIWNNRNDIRILSNFVKNLIKILASSLRRRRCCWVMCRIRSMIIMGRWIRHFEGWQMKRRLKIFRILVIWMIKSKEIFILGRNCSNMSKKILEGMDWSRMEVDSSKWLWIRLSTTANHINSKWRERWTVNLQWRQLCTDQVP